MINAMYNQRFMEEAIREARRAAEMGEVPVGAVIVLEGEIIARAGNRREVDGDPLAHAEILAIRQAAAVVGDWRLEGCSLYVTLEPCAMCSGALVLARIKMLVYGARDPKGGFCGSLGDLVRHPKLNHQLKVFEGILEEDCSTLLKDFFRSLRRRSRPATLDL